MQKTISTQQSASNISLILGLLETTAPRLHDLSRPLSGLQLRQALAPGKRSLTQEIAHLLNCEARSSESLYRALLEPEPLVAALHPEHQWGKLLQLEQLEFGDLLVYFTLRRTVLLRVLYALSDQDWARTMREPGKRRQESVYWKARALALHEQHHVRLTQERLLLALI
jgi:hypothetical protein